MTQEEKDLLLRDLCARLPYGVNINSGSDPIEPITKLVAYDGCDFVGNDGWEYFLGTLKPYLRPMSSMTEEEKDFVKQCIQIVTDENYDDAFSPSAWETMNDFVDYCNSRYLDYRGLISMGLALEAPKNMYNLK